MAPNSSSSARHPAAGVAEGRASVPVLQFRSVDKFFGARKILCGIDLEVAAGEVVAVIGPSGSGKSTLLRCMIVLEMPDGGEIRSGDATIRAGSPARDILAARRRTAMVFQQHNLFRNRTVIENISEGPRVVQKRPAGAVREEALDLLERMDLVHRAGAYPSELSGGEQQRIGIARALALKPELILFDEPTASLDPQRSREVLATMKSVAASGITMVVVTHELAFARDVADRIVFLDGGRVVETDSVDMIFGLASDERTKRFLSGGTLSSPMRR